MSSSQHLSHKSGEATGQVQLKKEEYLNKVSHAMNQNVDQLAHSQSQSHSQSHSQPHSQSHSQPHSQSHSHSHTEESDQNNPSLISQASNVIQQTGGQVKNMAQGAADAVKNTLGISPAAGTNNNPSNPAGSTRPSNPSSRNI